MRDYTLVDKLVKELKSITCNKCGNTKELNGEDYEKMWKSESFQSLTLHFGYGSKFDMEEWKFDVCEECLEEFVDSFKIKPEGFER